MTGAVLDTNVLLDLWVFEEEKARFLRATLASGRCVAFASQETLAELALVLARPEFGLSAERQLRLRSDWSAMTRLVPRVFPAPWQCTDRDDQPFLDLAHTARAQWLVTRDKALLKLARKTRATGLTIVAPAEFRFDS
jgi:putative PIN family toxin of toxin-antitoxin system